MSLQDVVMENRKSISTLLLGPFLFAFRQLVLREGIQDDAYVGRWVWNILQQC